MIKTKIQKVLAILALGAIATATLGSTYAATTIGTATVSWDATFDANIVWDDTFPGTATGTVTDIIVTATIDPTISMEISTWALDLGTLVATVESTASLDIEIGTNAANGVSITARSQSGGLTNTSNNTIKIQDNQDVFDDLIDESYMFASAINAATDSSAAGFTQTAALNSQVNNDTDEHIVYTSNKPQSATGVDDITFTVKATSDAQSAAGDYQDKITFTVVGNF